MAMGDILFLQDSASVGRDAQKINDRCEESRAFWQDSLPEWSKGVDSSSTSLLLLLLLLLLLCVCAEKWNSPARKHSVAYAPRASYLYSDQIGSTRPMSGQVSLPSISLRVSRFCTRQDALQTEL